MELKKTNIIVRNANDFKNYVDYVGELEQQCKKQKEVINKANEYIENRYDYEQNVLMYTFDKDNLKELYEILKGDSNE